MLDIVSGEIASSDNDIVARFDHDEAIINQIKRIPGARWDRMAKVWRIPVDRFSDISQIAIDHKWIIAPELTALDIDTEGISSDLLEYDGKQIHLIFPYDPVKVRAVKQIPGITWNKGSKGWTAPAGSLTEAVEWADRFRITVTEDTRAAAREIENQRAALIEESRETDADIEVAGLPLLPYQRAGVKYASTARRCFIADDMGLGKEQAVSSKVLTPDGWIRMGDITVGMMVTGSDGLPTKVVGVYPQGVKPLYRVTFSDGSSTLAGADHLWAVKTSLQKRTDSEWIVASTKEIMDANVRERKNPNGRTYEVSLAVKDRAGRRLHVPLVEPVRYSCESEELLLDPYLFGCWLGDGTAATGQITGMDKEIHEAFAKVFTPGKVQKKGNSKADTITYHGLRKPLRELNLLNNKHIPKQYLMSTPENRLRLIQGLMDTDGCPIDAGTEFSSSNKAIADGIVELVQSLGGVARVKTRTPWYTYKGERKQGKLSYRINIKLPAGMEPFTLPRKSEKYINPTKYQPVRLIESIEYSHDEEAQCIAVEAPDHLYVTDDFIVTHNTIQAIATLEYTAAYPAVVVCPPTLVLNWANEYRKWLPERNIATVKNRKDFPDRGYDVVVVGYSNIKAWENELKNHTGYVFDESHYCKSPDAQRTKAAVKISKTAPTDGVVLCLTGTPITNKPAEYAAQLEIIGKLQDFGGKWGFYRRYCNAFRDRFGQWNIDGHSNLDELNDRLRGNCYIRRTKEQVLPELPPVRHHELVVDGTAAGMKEYRQAEQDIVKYLMDRAAEIARELGESPRSAAVRAKMRAEASEHLVKIGVLRKLAAKAKMPAVVDFVDSYIEEGKKLVIAAHHREIVDELASRYGNLKIQGQMSVDEVERHKSRFQDLPVEDAPVIVLSIQAAKTGHTLTAAQDVLFVELPWTPSDVDQTYSRCHRLGQAGSVTSTYMLCDGTIDREIYGIIDRKRDVVDQAVEGGEINRSGSGAEVFDRYLRLAI